MDPMATVWYCIFHMFPMIFPPVFSRCAPFPPPRFAGRDTSLADLRICLTGAMRPERFVDTDAHFNLGAAETVQMGGGS